MEIILLEKIQNLGALGDVVRVKPGYARNYLIPKGKAMRATSSAKAEMEQRRKELQALETEKQAQAEQRAAIIDGITLEIQGRASDEGNLFGSVSNVEIADKLAERGAEIARNEIQLPDGPLKQVGEYEIEIILHPEVSRSIRVIVTALEG